jgi:hypothetical protein
LNKSYLIGMSYKFKQKKKKKNARVDILYITFIINLDRVSRRREGRESII